MKLFLVLISLALMSCSSQKKTVIESDQTNAMATETQKLALILQERDSSFDTPETLVIKDAKRLKSFYSKINRTRKPGIPVPDIDFSKEMIIIYCSGIIEQNIIPVLSMEKETDVEIVLSSTIQNGSNHTTKFSKASPFCVYKMPLSEKNIVIETNFE